MIECWAHAWASESLPNGVHHVQVCMCDMGTEYLLMVLLKLRVRCKKHPRDNLYSPALKTYLKLDDVRMPKLRVVQDFRLDVFVDRSPFQELQHHRRAHKGTVPSA